MPPEQLPETPRIRKDAAEILYLRSCINDLVGIVALPAIWNGGDAVRIVTTLADVLLDMLELDFVYVELTEPVGPSPIEIARVAQSGDSVAQADRIGGLLRQSFGSNSGTWPVRTRGAFGNSDLSISTLQLGISGGAGVVVAGSRRIEFPLQTERLLVGVAVNQTVIGLQEAWRMSEQKRHAGMLDKRVTDRTKELAAANEDLRREVAERRVVEEKLRLEEKELKHSQALLKHAQQLSSTGSFSWRVETDIVTFSEQTFRIYGFEPGLRVTLDLIASRTHPEDVPSLREMVAGARGRGGDVDYEYRLLMPDESVRYLHLVAHGALGADGAREYIGAIQDVTQRHLAEDALTAVRTELAHVARATSLGALTASIAHEVNQPLAGIITNASTCLRMLARVPPNVDGARETAIRMIRDGNRAAEVIKRLRTLFSRRAATADSVNLNEAAQEVVALSRIELQRARIIVRPELAHGLPAVTGDRVQLQQVILNLLLNAADAMSDVHDRPREVFIRTHSEEGALVLLSVADGGVGFAPQARERMFEAFYTTKSEGMGIGLSVSRSIIENHKGRIWAAANEDRGAIFSFALPRRTPDF